MSKARRKRLIEVAFPLEEVSAHSRREKKVRHGHISSLHIWWARRPLAACRAFIYASLVDDPETDSEREQLLKEIADLASWDAVRHPDRVVRTKDDGGSGLTGTKLLKRARRRILDGNGGKPPKLLDPFAGGGAIPLEALRLGCEVEASDLNPVAVLILKGTVEYPQKYGQPDSRPVPEYILNALNDGSQSSYIDGSLAEDYRRNPLGTDVRYWGNWMLERAREELAEFYPSDADGSAPVAYLWSRTVPCPNCDAEMPLIRQYWLARKPKKKVALQPVIDRDNNRVDFEVVEGPDVTGNPALATTSRGDTKCLLCGQVVKAAQVHDAGQAGVMDARLIAIVLQPHGRGGKRYRRPTKSDLDLFASAKRTTAELKYKSLHGLPAIPDEPLAYHPQYMLVRGYGLDEWGKLFNDRQLLALTTFARLVSHAHAEMLGEGMDPNYARAVATYLGLAVDKLADYNATVSRWGNEVESSHNALARQALPMVWDYAEVNPIGATGGSWASLLAGLVRALDAAIVGEWCGEIRQAEASHLRATCTVVLTDPPYYDAINYADLSDFFYVWLRRSIGFLHPNLLALPLTPKREQTVMNIYANRGAVGRDRKEAAKEHYVDGMAQAFWAMAQSMEPGGLTGVVFAHTDPDAWATLIEGLLGAGLVPDASWPIDTELQNKISSMNRANLRTSVWMACRKRVGEAGDTFLSDILEDMRPVIRERLLYFWSKGIRGADFFISAIGPALSVFGRHGRVLRPDGSEVSVRDFLDIVRRESTAVALGQVLQGADLGMVDSITRQYVTWVWSYSRAPLDAGEAIALCLATGAAYDEMTRPNSIASEAREKSKKVVKLRTIRERAMVDDELGNGPAARPTPLVDQLQHAAWLWGENLTDRLGAYRGMLGETRWTALRTLGQAVAECLPDGDEDRRIILGLLGSSVMAAPPPDREAIRTAQPQGAGAMLPGFEKGEDSD